MTRAPKEKIALILENDAIDAMQIGVDTLGQLHALFQSLDGCAARGQGDTTLAPEAALGRIRELAGLGARVSTVISNLIDCMRERFRDQHIPAILAAVQGDAQ